MRPKCQIASAIVHVATNMPIRLLIGQTYRVSSLRLVGGPSWIASEHFDIKADSLPLSFLAGVISGEVNRTVVDRTGLTGRFHFHLT